MGLIQDIENAATDSSVPIVDLLRKCKVLSSRLKHNEFSTWINCELNGYQKEALPEYRKINLPSPVGDFSGIFGSGIKNAPIPFSLIPEKIKPLVASAQMINPIVELEDFSKANKNLSYQWSGDIVAYMQQHSTIYKDMVLIYAHSSLPPSVFKGIVDTVRTRLLDYVIAIQTELSDIDNIKPSDPPPIAAATLHQTFHTTILGGQAIVGGQGPQILSDNLSNVNLDNSTHNLLTDERVLELLGQLKKATQNNQVEDSEEAIEALSKVENQLKKTKPDLEKVKSYLDITAHIVNLAPVANQLYQHLVHLLK